MSVKKTIVTSLLAMGVSLPLLTQAENLSITNNTKLDSTVVANKGACSTILGPVGVTRAGTTNVVPETKIALACALSILKKTDCEALVFMTDHCNVGNVGAKPIATVYFDIQKDKSGKIIGTGLRTDRTVIHDSSYSVSGGGFNLAIHGGPAAITAKK